MASKFPFFPFYVDDFAASAVVEAMTAEQVGAYILLLCKAWGQTPPGSLVSDDAILARWARLDRARWDDIKLGVLSAFTLRADGRYYQRRMEEEYRKLTKKMSVRSKAGAAGALARWEKNGKRIAIANGNANADAMRSEWQTLSVSLSGGSEDSSETEDNQPPVTHTRQTHAIANAFAIFWAAYPKKVAEARARKAWAELSPGPELVSEIMAAIERQKLNPTWSTSGGRYVPNAATWLAERRWTDQIPDVCPEPSARPAAKSTREKMAAYFPDTEGT